MSRMKANAPHIEQIFQSLNCIIFLRVCTQVM